jgi:hypothetical protein
MIVSSKLGRSPREKWIKDIPEMTIIRVDAQNKSKL